MPTFVPNPVTVRLQAPSENYRRADLVLHGIDHSRASYEGRLFVNTPDAAPDTPPDDQHGYVGSFWVFGHGGCAGDEGHCEVPTSRRPFDVRPEHQLIPMSAPVTVTEKLRAMIRPGESFTVRVVPVIRPENLEHLPEGLISDVLSFERIDLLTYQ